MIFRRRNAVPRIGRDNGKLWPSATPDLKRKRRDFLHKLSNYYATEYDLVAVEGLDAKELVELPETHGIGRERRGERSFECLSTSANAKEHTLPKSIQGNTTKACASCGVKTDKPLWVREHSCPSCGFEADRDANAAWNILSRGLKI